MEIRTLNITDLKAAQYNPRKDLQPQDEEYQKLKRSIDEFGYIEPIVWNERTGNVVGGHQRLKILIENGINEVQVSVVNLDDTEEKALNIALNKISGEWDNDKLAALLAELSDQSEIDELITGFGAEEIENLLKDVQNVSGGGAEALCLEENEAYDLSAELQKSSFVEKGDVWIIGRHKLVCGDATDKSDVELLMGNEKARLAVTDPPYNVAYNSSLGLSIANDKKDNSEFYEFLHKSFLNMAAHLEKGGAAYIFHSDTEGLNFRKAFVEAGFHLAGVCIWVKNQLVMGRSDYQWKHEPVLYGFIKGGHNWYSDRKQTTVWEFDKPQRNNVHPTMKPLDLVVYPIMNSSQPGDTVIDLFGGSGSTLIACEQTERKCRIMELDGKYASVILRRYVEFKCNDENVYVERNGEKIPYSAIVKDVKQKA